ncbi:MAG: hypothetical protein A2X12_07490 [Bacteroidetes bacterium GWE2_29_8]|nr:MAG: hypothetical protein A2X12_07490 [Bacteroidetes bacterium GWE2_29_8]
MDIEEKYKILINARNFHYENYNKWMTYFYVAIGALFVGYCSIIASDKNLIGIEYSINILGYIVGILWYWSSKGYYYWNINFITLVNYYEEKLLNFPETERIYFVFANKNIQNNYANPASGANISTSKIAILFSFIITSCWGALIFYKLLNLTNCICYDGLTIIFSLIASIILTILISYLIPEKWLKSKIEHFPDLKIQQ